MTAIAPFAEVETALATDVIGILANAVATVCLPADSAGQEIAVIFDDAYLYIDMGSGMESTAPAVTLLEEDMPEPMVDALRDGNPVALEIGGCTYTVVERKPDGAGAAVLRLRK